MRSHPNMTYFIRNQLIDVGLVLGRTRDHFSATASLAYIYFNSIGSLKFITKIPFIYPKLINHERHKDKDERERRRGGGGGGRKGGSGEAVHIRD